MRITDDRFFLGGGTWNGSLILATDANALGGGGVGVVVVLHAASEDGATMVGLGRDAEILFGLSIALAVALVLVAAVDADRGGSFGLHVLSGGSSVGAAGVGGLDEVTTVLGAGAGAGAISGTDSSPFFPSECFAGIAASAFLRSSAVLMDISSGKASSPSRLSIFCMRMSLSLTPTTLGGSERIEKFDMSENWRPKVHEVCVIAPTQHPLQMRVSAPK